MHVLGPDFWSFASVRCTAHVGEISTDPGDRAGQDLLDLYNTIADSNHPDSAEFFEAQVMERRCLVTLRPEEITGTGWTS
jgi:phosphoglycerate dehydrogenase-like enzyme